MRPDKKPAKLQTVFITAGQAWAVSDKGLPPLSGPYFDVSFSRRYKERRALKFKHQGGKEINMRMSPIHGFKMKSTFVMADLELVGIFFLPNQ